jgi:hypothetical protein
MIYLSILRVFEQLEKCKNTNLAETFSQQGLSNVVLCKAFLYNSDAYVKVIRIYRP